MLCCFEALAAMKLC